MLNRILWIVNDAIKPWKLNKNRCNHLNTININFSNSKSLTSNCIGKQKQCFGGSKSALVSIHGPTEGERRSRLSSWHFCESSSIIVANYLINLEIRTTILIIKNNLSNKARFNLNKRNYFMNARKRHINTRRRY